MLKAGIDDKLTEGDQSVLKFHFSKRLIYIYHWNITLQLDMIFFARIIPEL